MDLNEKLAARRRELAIEAEKVAQAEAAHRRALAIEAEKAAQIEAARQRELAIEAEKVKQAQQEAIDAEVAKRLAEKGIEVPAKEAPPSAVWSESAVNAAVDQAISKAATERMSGFENFTFFSLLALGIAGFFVKWWVGLLFVIWSVVYLGKRTDKHKQAIIADGKAKADLAKAQKE